MAYRIEVAPRANRSINEARDYLARQSPARAERWLQGLFKKISALKSFPFRCPVAAESETYSVEIRELLYGKGRNTYRILYAIQGECIRVLFVWRASRGSIDF